MHVCHTPADRCCETCGSHIEGSVTEDQIKVMQFLHRPFSSQLLYNYVFIQNMVEMLLSLIAVVSE